MTEESVVLALATDELATRLGVTVQTVNRWTRGDPPSPTAVLALRYLMGFIDNSAWRDWRVDHRSDKLCAPNGFSFRPAELEHWELVFHTNESLWRERRKRPLNSDRRCDQVTPRATLATDP